ncbi:hypothetical protein [Breoghania sp. L-A4]|uniref:hypothetical protein n=1 Tax=Breoghania sp. L-A4 TaxID=2304600 RepID=UPI000E3580BB|nr:hypothetical protein [Breoghania sp. L-A4]AXS41376.1 hypothetical protein D1F64_16845 [Breoghania sp. L-A4]
MVDVMPKRSASRSPLLLAGVVFLVLGLLLPGRPFPPMVFAGDGTSGRAAGDGSFSSTARPARDGDVAVREEFDAAVRRDTPEGYELFILRHPDHPLAEEARRRQDKARGSTDKDRQDFNPN